MNTKNNKSTFSLVLNIILGLSLTLLFSCATEPIVDIDLLNYRLIEKRRITPEPGVKLTHMAATVLLQMENQGNIFTRWEDIVSQFMATPQPVKKTKNIKIQGDVCDISIRIYTPFFSSFKDKEMPVILFIHGGGFISGSIKSHDNIARMLCKYSEAIVVSVEYRLAPEYSYPAAPDDCYTTLLWIEKHIADYGGDPKKIAVAGDSAGGLLSVSMVERSERLNGPKIGFMALYYPALSFEDIETPSRLIYGGSNGYYVIDNKLFMEMRKVFFQESNLRFDDPQVSPFNLDLSKYSMPPTFIMACQCGPLRDEALLFAEKLKKNGVRCHSEIAYGMIHGFLNCDLFFPVEVHQILRRSGKMIKKTFSE